MTRLRQQLILAQVRIMELEDIRDELAPKLAGLEALLRQAQSMADAKLDEAAHLQRVLAAAQAHGEELDRLHRRASGELSALAAQLAQRDRQLAAAETARRQLATELQAIQSSRSWRWTAWLRALAGK